VDTKRDPGKSFSQVRSSGKAQTEKGSDPGRIPEISIDPSIPWSNSVSFVRNLFSPVDDDNSTPRDVALFRIEFIQITESNCWAMISTMCDPTSFTPVTAVYNTVTASSARPFAQIVDITDAATQS
jgi:hypothetical protein